MIYYYFLIHDTYMDYSLLLPCNDQDVIVVSRYIDHNKEISVFNDHGRTLPYKYFKSRGKVILE